MENNDITVSLTPGVVLGAQLYALEERRRAWSHKTFGTPDKTGSLGALKHLAEEVQEAIKELEAGNMPAFREEMADISHLTHDILDRADISLEDHLMDRWAKHEINEARDWQTADTDGIYRHVRAEAE